MARLTLLYTQPEDAEGTAEYSFTRHLFLVNKMPNVKDYELSKVVDPEQDAKSSSSHMLEIWFDSIGDLEEALDSEQGRQIIAERSKDSVDGPTILVSEDEQ